MPTYVKKLHTYDFNKIKNGLDLPLDKI